MEVWRPITEYNMFAFDGRYKYEVSSYGNVRRAGYYGGRRRYIEPVMLKLRKDKRNGRFGITLIFETVSHYFYIDTLVAKTFLKRPEGTDKVIHKDGDLTNNRVENLMWSASPERHWGFSGVAVKQYTPSGELVAEFVSLTEAGRAVGATRHSISRCCKNGGLCVGFRWEYADESRVAC